MKNNSESKFTLFLKGRASGKEVKYIIQNNDVNLDILSLCQKYEIPMASSCHGEGICQKCVFNNGQLACKINFKNILKDNNSAMIVLDYL